MLFLLQAAVVWGISGWNMVRVPMYHPIREMSVNIAEGVKQQYEKLVQRLHSVIEWCVVVQNHNRPGEVLPSEGVFGMREISVIQEQIDDHSTFSNPASPTRGSFERCRANRMDFAMEVADL